MFFCGLDFGTTNTKAVLLDEAMKLCGVVTLPIEPQAIPDQRSAQVWMDHLNHAFASFQYADLIKNEKVILSMTAQGGTFVVLDAQNSPVSAAVSLVG